MYKLIERARERRRTDCIELDLAERMSEGVIYEREGRREEEGEEKKGIHIVPSVNVQLNARSSSLFNRLFAFAHAPTITATTSNITNFVFFANRR